MKEKMEGERHCEWSEGSSTDCGNELLETYYCRHVGVNFRAAEVRGIYRVRQPDYLVCLGAS